MSRIGKLPITIPSGVTVTVNSNRVNVVGPKGQLEWVMPDGVEAKIEEGKVLEVTEVRVGGRTIEASDYTIDKTTTPHKIVFNSGVLDSTKTEQIFIDVTVTD